MAKTNATGAGPEMNVDLALELFSIAGSLNSTLDLDFLLQKIGAAAEQLTESEASSIMLVTDDKKHLFFRVASGEQAKALKTMTLPIGQGIAGWVAQNRQPQTVNDTKSDPRFAGKFDKRGAALLLPKLIAWAMPVMDKRDWAKIRAWAQDVFA